MGSGGFSTGFGTSGPCLVGGGVLREVGLESVEVTSSFVLDSSLVVLGVVDQGWVGFDGDSWDFVGSRVHLGDDDIFEVTNVGTEVLPDWGEGLAVTAPWSVVLDEDVLGGVADNFLPVSSDEGLNWAVVGFWDWLALQVCLEGSGLEVSDESSNGLSADFLYCLAVSVLSEVLSELDDTEAWSALSVNTDVLSEFGLDAFGGGRFHEDNLASEFIGSLSESLLVVLAGVVGEEDDGWLLFAEDWVNGIFVEVHETWGLEAFSESDDSVLGGGTRVGGESLVEVADNNNTGSVETEVGSDISVSGVEELEGVTEASGSSSLMGLEKLTLEGTNEDNSLLDVALHGLEVSAGLQLGRRAGLLFDPGDDSVGSASASVVGFVSITVHKGNVKFWAQIGRAIRVKSKAEIELYNLTYRKKFRVGNPLISKRVASSLCSVASTLAMYLGGSMAASSAAAFTNSGASFLQ